MSDISNAIGGQAFDPNAHETTGDFAVMPAGWYPLEIEEAEVKETKAGTGHYLNLRLCVLSEQYNGRKVFDRITLSNPNQQATEIGQKQLATLGQALGMAAIQDSQELIGGQIDGKLKVVKDPQYGEDNEVASYRPLGGGQQGQPPQQQQAGYNGNNGGFVPGPAQAQAQPAQQAAQPQQQTQQQQPANANSNAGGGATPPWKK